MAAKNPTPVDTKELTATRFNTKQFQLQRKNHFEIQFGKNSNGTSFIDSDLRFMLASFPLPKETTESSDINYFNQTIKVAGKTTFDTSTMVLRDAIEYDTELKFLNWRKQVYDPEKGDPDSGIAPGTAFEDIPDTWVCPVCGVGKDMFQKQD